MHLIIPRETLMLKLTSELWWSRCCLISPNLLSEEKVRDGGDDGEGPAEEGDQAGPPDVRHGEDVERAADGEVSLQGEGEDCQHWGVARSVS